MERTSRTSASEETTGTIDFDSHTPKAENGKGGRTRSLSTGSSHSVSSNNSASSHNATFANASTGAPEGIELHTGMWQILEWTMNLSPR